MSAVETGWADQEPPDEVGADVQPAGRRLRLTWACDITPEPVVWAWRDEAGGRIPSGSLSIAAGREGTGKSSWALWLAAQVTRGTLPGSLHGKPRAVLYVAIEDSWKHTLVPRLLAAGADLSKVARVDSVDEIGGELTLSLPADNALLEGAIRNNSVGMVVIDPLMSVMGVSDTNDSRKVRKALDPLARIADRTGCLILGIAHFNKGSGTDPASLITGSGAFKDVPRSVFGFAKDSSDGSRVMTQVKNSLGRDDLPSYTYRIDECTIATPTGEAITSRFALTGATDRSVAEVLRDNSSDPAALDDKRDAAGWLADHLAECGGQAKAADIQRAAKDAGVDWGTIRNARQKVATTQRHGFGQGSHVVWALRHDVHTSRIVHIDHGPQDAGSMCTMAGSMDPAGDAGLNTSTPPRPPTCTVCGHPLDPVLAAAGETTHPTCSPEGSEEGGRNRAHSSHSSAHPSAGQVIPIRLAKNTTDGLAGPWPGQERLP